VTVSTNARTVRRVALIRRDSSQSVGQIVREEPQLYRIGSQLKDLLPSIFQCGSGCSFFVFADSRLKTGLFPSSTIYSSTLSFGHTWTFSNYLCPPFRFSEIIIIRPKSPPFSVARTADIPRPQPGTHHQTRAKE
jgi:hypothetical protein